MRLQQEDSGQYAEILQDEPDDQDENIRQLLEEVPRLVRADKVVHVIADFLESICHGLSDILHRHTLSAHLEFLGRRTCHRYDDPQQKVKRNRDSIEEHQKEKHDTYGSRVPILVGGEIFGDISQNTVIRGTLLAFLGCLGMSLLLLCPVIILVVGAFLFVLENLFRLTHPFDHFLYLLDRDDLVA